jgi:large subunit ribosomal protein L22
MEAKAILRNCPLPPRKMRLLADQVRGQKVERALNILTWNQRPGYALYLNKLIRSAVANWSQKNSGARIEDNNTGKGLPSAKTHQPRNCGSRYN